MRNGGMFAAGLAMLAVMALAVAVDHPDVAGATGWRLAAMFAYITVGCAFVAVGIGEGDND